MLSRTGTMNQILTKRLRLLQLDASQARDLLEGRPDAERPWAGGYPIDGTMVAAEAFLRTVDAGIDSGPYGMYQLVRQEDSMVVGDIGFHAPPDSAGTVAVGYGLATRARGRGYATEALQALIDWALAQPEVRRVEADTAHGNVRSQRVLERAGMRLIGRNDRLRFYRYP
jgi:RimJ/RimL family protein N-acetyltransferase